MSATHTIPFPDDDVGSDTHIFDMVRIHQSPNDYDTAGGTETMTNAVLSMQHMLHGDMDFPEIRAQLNQRASILMSHRQSVDLDNRIVTPCVNMILVGAPTDMVFCQDDIPVDICYDMQRVADHLNRALAECSEITDVSAALAIARFITDVQRRTTEAIARGTHADSWNYLLLSDDMEHDVVPTQVVQDTLCSVLVALGIGTLVLQSYVDEVSGKIIVESLDIIRRVYQPLTKH